MNANSEKVHGVLDSIMSSHTEVPSKRELTGHAPVMDEHIAHVPEILGLSTPIEGYTFSDFEKNYFWPHTTHAGPLTTVNPPKQYHFGSDASSLQDNKSATTWLGRIRGGVGSDDAAGGAASGADSGPPGEADSGAAGGASGGAAGVAGDHPPPGSNPPSDHGNNNNYHRVSS